ncbi:MAG: helix-turn-helix transcriptional regulator [Defluviitaleaceae bacterium]|nr:helix-turn-helix transcriptional regulator [Defluviitaleaceae bacterium]
MQHIENIGVLSVVDKIKLLRNKQEVSQYKLADIALTSQRKISNIETGIGRYIEDELLLVKKYLGIEGMPLTDDECNTFRGRLYHWRDMIRKHQIDEAEKLQDELKGIVNLEIFDFDMPTLYRLFEALLLIVRNKGDDLVVAEEKLRTLENSLDDMTEEHRYYYDFHMGALYARRNDFETAIEFYYKALDRKKKQKDNLLDSEEKIYYNLALCYTDLEQLSRATVFLSRMPKIGSEDKTSSRSLGVDIMRAMNYYKIGLPNEAEELLNDCLMRAKIVNNQPFIGLSLAHLGAMHRYLQNWEKAIEYLDQALDAFGTDAEHFRYSSWVLYFKFRCRMELGGLAKIEKELRDLKNSLSKREIDEYSDFLETLYKTLLHIVGVKKCMSRYDKNSVDYLETTSVQFFEKYSHRLEAIDCYKLLVQHFERTSQQKKSLEANKAMVKIYERMV